MKVLCILLFCAFAQAWPTPLERPVAQRESRVINGVDATAGAWPWQASLQRSNSHFCGGSLIALRYVMTAAHCEITSSQVLVGLGGTESDNLDQYIIQDSFTMHPSYNPNTYDYDYGIITLVKDATLNEVVGLATLPQQGKDYPPRTTAIASGWGYVDMKGPNGVRTNNLQEAQLPLISEDECQSIWGTGIAITDRMQCAGGEGTVTCMGDSGGPLVVLDQGQYVLIGATSWGSSRCYTNYPSAFAKLSAVRSWIDSVAGT